MLAWSTWKMIKSEIDLCLEQTTEQCRQKLLIRLTSVCQVKWVWQENKTLILGYYWWAGIQADSFQCWIVTVWESISDEQNQYLPSHSWSLWLGLCWCIDHIWVCRELWFCRFHPDQSWHSDILQMIQESLDSGEVPCPCQLPWCISQCHRCLLLLSRSQFEILISLIGFIDHH